MKKCKLLALVTIFYPDIKTVASNILRYIDDVDMLIIWDNSPSSQEVKQKLSVLLKEKDGHILWYSANKNSFIAPAINFAWKKGKEMNYDLLLIMDQDSQWTDFPKYRNEVESHFLNNEIWVYTPYITDYDIWEKNAAVMPRRIFINSGTIIPLSILDAINGVDETFPLDALDHDTALRILKRGFTVCSLTSHEIHHSMGQPSHSNKFRLLTPNYPPTRLYSIVRSHIINFRKNRHWMNRGERLKFFKEFIFWTLIRIILVEKGKKERLLMYWKGISEGIRYDINKTKR